MTSLASLLRLLQRVPRLRCAAGLAAGALLGAAAPAAAQAAMPADACARLARLAFPDATVTSSTAVAAGKLRMPQQRFSMFPFFNLTGRDMPGTNPAFCRVAATLKPSTDSAIRMELWLPLERWNGKFLGVGNFGWAGSIIQDGMLSGVQAGYAVAMNDTGHDAAQPDGDGGRWALGHPEKLVDYAYRADHEMTVKAKAIVRAFYGTAAAKAYWVGCSLGGLEGLIEAKRYPADYDGIVAGAPPNPIVLFNALQLQPARLVTEDPRREIPREKYAMIHAAVLKDCATPVGQHGGFVEEPDKCGFQPRTLLCKGEDAPDCLTAPQVDLMERTYAGLVDPKTGRTIFPGPARGTELDLGMFATAKPMSVALDLFRYAAFQDPDWGLASMGQGSAIAAASARIDPLMRVDADLTPFFARGGKLMFYIGWMDYHNPLELIGYYKSVIAASGPRAAASTRLFTVPGMGHCANGAGCDTFDKLGTIDHWVAGGEVPARIETRKLVEGRVVRSRPICAYPAVARYDGKGDMDRATSFTCATGT